MSRSETRPLLTVASLLASQTEPVRELALALRALVRSTLPHIEERAYPRWRAIGFHHGTEGYIVGLFPLADRVKVSFEHGARLSDPLGLLEAPQPGDEAVRHINLTELDATTRDGLVALLLEAAATP